MARGAGDLRCDAHAGTRSTRRFMGLVMGLVAAMQSREGLAQWHGLPDPPDPPDEVDCVACVPPGEGAADTPSPPSTPSPAATSALPAPHRPRFETTLGMGVALTANVVRRNRDEGADYGIGMSRREGTLQASWNVFGRRLVGLRLGMGVGGGRPILNFNGRGFEWFVPGPVRVHGVSISMDALIGLVVRAGPVRLGPAWVVNTLWLRDGAGYTTFDAGAPYTTPERLIATGFSFFVGAQLHPRVLASIETRVLLQGRLPGASLRFGLAVSLPAG